MNDAFWVVQVHPSRLRIAGGSQWGDSVHAGARCSFHSSHPGHRCCLHPGCLQGVHRPQGLQGKKAAPHAAWATAQGRSQVRYEHTHTLVHRRVMGFTLSLIQNVDSLLQSFQTLLHTMPFTFCVYLWSSPFLSLRVTLTAYLSLSVILAHTYIFPLSLLACSSFVICSCLTQYKFVLRGYWKFLLVSFCQQLCKIFDFLIWLKSINIRKRFLLGKSSKVCLCLDFCCLCGAFHTKYSLKYSIFPFRKREEEQRRREAVQQVATTEKRKVSLGKTEQEKLSLVNIIGDLSVNDSLVETKKSSKTERTKTKEERHKGTTVQECLYLL